MTQTMERSTTAGGFDQARADAFLGKVLGDTVGLATTAMASIGDRLGFFKQLAKSGSTTSGDLAARTRTQERYVREWLAAMANAGYLEYDPTSGRYTLPPEHVPVLAQEAGPVFFGGSMRSSSAYSGHLRNSWATSDPVAGSTSTTTPRACTRASTASPPGGSKTC